MGEHVSSQNLLGAWLKDRRAKLDPAAFGFPPERRRTAGLQTIREVPAHHQINSSTDCSTWRVSGKLDTS